MRVVFLDIDGVLNNVGTPSNNEACWRPELPQRLGLPITEQLRVPHEPACVARLNRLLAETGAKLVISSSWRLFASVEYLGPALVRCGIVGDFIGETPDLINDVTWLAAWQTREAVPFKYERLERGLEIWEWLGLHPEVEEFVILDDCRDMAHLAPALVLTDPSIGLDDPDVERAKHLLGKSRALLAQLRTTAWRGLYP